MGSFLKKKSFMDIKLENWGIFLDGLWHNYQILPDIVKHIKIYINKAIVNSRNFKCFSFFGDIWHLNGKPGL